MKLLEIMSNVKYKLLQGEDAEVKNIVIDSRKVRNGSMFFCIKGFKSDGHKFIENAISQGATAIVVEHENFNKLPEGVTVLKVEDTREALAYAAAAFYNFAYKSFDLIGVTGTNGKTSITYFIEAILNQYKKNVGVIGTIELRIGGEKLNIPFDTSTTPDPVELHKIFMQMKEQGANSVVMEVTSHALALKKVCGMHFDTCIFTNLTQDHLDLHGSMENYSKEKAKLFKMCNCAVINKDDCYADFMIENVNKDSKVITYGIEKDCDLKAIDVQYSSSSVQFKLQLEGKLHEFFVPIAGKFSAYNALAAIGCAVSLNVPVEVIKDGLKNMKSVPGRIQSVPNNKGFNVIIDYAHTPDGLLNVLSAVRNFTEGKLITVFGCGGDRDRAKRSIMGEIAGKLSDYCVITSDNPRTEQPESIIEEIEPGVSQTNCQYEKVTDRKEAIARAISIAKPSDSVVIAGKGHEDYQIFADRTIYFSDYETAKENL